MQVAIQGSHAVTLCALQYSPANEPSLPVSVGDARKPSERATCNADSVTSDSMCTARWERADNHAPSGRRRGGTRALGLTCALKDARGSRSPSPHPRPSVMDANQQPDEAYRGADPFAVLRSRTSSRARAPGCSKGMTAERSAFANANPRDKLWVYHRGPRCPARRF